MNCHDILLELQRTHPVIESFKIITFLDSPSLQSRLISAGNGFSEQQWEQISSLRRTTGRGFIEASLLTATNGDYFSEPLAASALYHQRNSPAFEISATSLSDFLNTPMRSPTAVNSKVCLGQEELHIPLLDFKIKESHKAEAAAYACIKSLKLSGYLLASGNSYHFYGKSLVTEAQLIEILAKFSLLHPISDRLWSAHQIIERSASLRISPRGGRLPTLVCKID